MDTTQAALNFLRTEYGVPVKVKYVRVALEIATSTGVSIVKLNKHPIMQAYYNDPLRYDWN